MTDTPGRPPDGREPEQRLPAVVPPTEGAPVERFTSPPSIRRIEFSPERAAQVVRQSANARWVGFLGIIIIILFISLYWFYELGTPGGLTTARQAMEIEAQQVTKVERGYLVYEANCARCHGEQGEGGDGPILNRQDKLFAHLNEAYIRNILTVGGRYACGDPHSRMPIWADTGNPPGPLNYRQVEELIAFLLATNEREYVVRDEHLLDPVVDPVTGEIKMFTGWRDPNYQPEPGATPFPDCWQDEFTAGASASPGASPAASVDPNATVVDVSASSSSAFDVTEISGPAGQPFVIHFFNNEPGVLHNVEVKDAGGTSVMRGDIVPGVIDVLYDVPELAAGEYSYACSVHPNMTGTLTAE